MHHIHRYDNYLIQEANVKYHSYFESFFTSLLEYLTLNQETSFYKVFGEDGELRLSKLYGRVPLEMAYRCAQQGKDPFVELDMPSLLGIVLHNLRLGFVFSQDNSKPRGTFRKNDGIYIRINSPQVDLRTVGEMIPYIVEARPLIAHEFTHVLDSFRIELKMQMKAFAGKPYKRRVDFMGYTKAQLMDRDHYYNFTHEVHAYINMALYELRDQLSLPFPDFQNAFVRKLDEVAPLFRTYASEETMRKVWKAVAEYYQQAKQTS